MASKFTASAATLKPDTRYNSILVSKLINNVMERGKKSVATGIVYRAMDFLNKQIKDATPLEVVQKAIDNVKPAIEVKSKRVGGATYQVPVQVGSKRQQTLAIRWILQATKTRKGKPMHQRLAGELMAAFNREGAAYTTRENVHRMADANKAFAHYSW